MIRFYDLSFNDGQANHHRDRNALSPLLQPFQRRAKVLFGFANQQFMSIEIYPSEGCKQYKKITSKSSEYSQQPLEFTVNKNDPPICFLALASAIDRRPLIVSSDTSVAEALTMMGKAQSSCVLPNLNLPPETLLLAQARASCVLVMEQSQLIGVLAEQDCIRAIASGRDLKTYSITEAIAPAVVLEAEPDSSSIFEALSLLRQYSLRHLPIIDSNQQLVGVISFESICQALPLDELLKDMQISDVMSTKVVQAGMTTSVRQLATLMAKHGVSSVVLIDEDEMAQSGSSFENNGSPQSANVPVGLITERDLLQLQALELDLDQIQGQAVMRSPVPCFPASASVLIAHWHMRQAQSQQAIVAEPTGNLQGMISLTNFLLTLDLKTMQRAIAQIQQSIEQFEAQKAALSQAATASPLSSTAELVEQLEHNRLLATIALRIRESLNADEILQTSVDEVRRFLDTDRVLIYRFNPDFSGTVVVESVAPGWQPALGSTVTDTCFGKTYAPLYLEGRIQVVEDIYTAGLTQCHINILALFDVRANLVVPILQGEHLWGLLCAYHCSGPRLWQAFEVDLLKQLATHIAIAIQQSELYQKAQTELAERKRADEKLQASLKEKEILLKEIHHRVKNNLQIISSLLKLQSSYIEDEQALTMFKDSQNRIRSMALIHEKLYQAKDLSKIDFSEYIHDLTHTLMRSYSAHSQAVRLNVDIRNIRLSIDTAIPCGLIINELVSNAFKHAFPSSQPEGEISIKLHSISDGKFILSVRDNGVGFPPHLDFQNTETLGLELVCTLTAQLEGEIQLFRDQGTEFIITFSDIGEEGGVQANGKRENLNR